MTRRSHHAFSVAILVLMAAAMPADAAFTLEKDDHICIIGNTLAERMQHDGWMETMLHARFPKHNLVIRNLGFSADTLTIRLRSMNFGSPDEWLSGKGSEIGGYKENRFKDVNTQADVIFAFFGYNESFAGEAGLEKFKKDLEGFINHTLSRKYNGESAPRLVLFSPIAQEDLADPNLPDGEANNKRLVMYSQAMAEVAAANNVTFVDLFGPMETAYAQNQEELTINGVHLNERGNRAVAEIIDESLFGNVIKHDEAELVRLNEAVKEKNFYWFNRYRVTDGYSTYGARAFLTFHKASVRQVNPQGNFDDKGLLPQNYETVQRELQILDIKTANRDKVVWAAANGRMIRPDDSNLPPLILTETNKPGKGPNGEHIILSGEDSIKHMTIAQGYKVTLFASEEMFPELINPVQMAFDTRGRLWVAAWNTYPHWNPGETPRPTDRLLILEDTDNDGKADVCKTFVDDIHNPTGFEFFNGGVYVSQGPDILFLKDTDGDDKCDVKVRVLHGMDTADTHHTANSFVLDPGGGLYWQEGTFHHTQVETPRDAAVRNVNGSVYRFEPKTFKFRAYGSKGFANPHGHVFTSWGQDFMHDGTGAVPFDTTLFAGHVDYPRKHGGPPSLYKQRTRPCPATEMVSSPHFPEESQGNLLVQNVIGFQGILQYRIEEDGASFKGTEVEPILYSDDENFRPVDLEFGPDGALYFVDWMNPVIGHMQHNLRDPSRDRKHGRVYRVTYPSRPLAEVVPIDGERANKLLDALKSPTNRVRYRARIELSERDTENVISALKSWVTSLDKNDPMYERFLLEALWTYQLHNVPNEPLLKKVLQSNDHRARAAATKVIRHWRDRLSDPIALVKQMASDEHPRVRLEAVVAASDYTEPEAVLAALECLKHPRDGFLEYSLRETMGTLDRYWKPALAAGKLEIPADNPAAANFLLDSVPADQLHKMPKTEPVLVAMLTRHGVSARDRDEAWNDLTRKRRSDSGIEVLIEAINAVPEGGHQMHVLQELGGMLMARPPRKMKDHLQQIEKLATDGASVGARQVGYAAWMTAAGSPDAAWNHASRSAGTLTELLDSIHLVPSNEVREALYPRVRALLKELPSHLQTQEVTRAKRLMVDYFDRVPNDMRLQSFKGMKPDASGPVDAIRADVPQRKKADAYCLRFTGSLYVENTGQYTFATKSDDGSRLFINSKEVVNNDGLHGVQEKSGKIQLDAGEHDLAVTYFDNGGIDFLEATWSGPGLATQQISAVASAGDGVTNAAIRSLAHFPGHEADSFNDLAQLVVANKSRSVAMQTMLRIDRKHWNAAQSGGLLKAVAGYVDPLPNEQRSTPAVAEALNFGKQMATMLPAHQAAKVQQVFDSLNVNLIVIRPIEHEMLYDKTQITVEAGKPVVILFENVDAMPHNLVITLPGARAEIGQAAEALGPAGEAKQYIPDSKKVLHHTKLLFPGESEKMQFNAPSQPGNYDYLCTFPGHWMKMYGVMKVIPAGADDAALGGESIVSIVDGILKLPEPRGFVKDWKYEDIVGDIGKMRRGRNFESGKQMFTVAGCIKCHKMQGEGQVQGPELTNIAETYKGKDLLRQIIDPSAIINENYQAVIVETEDGDRFTGIINKTTDKSIFMITDLMKPDEIKEIPKDTIESQRNAPNSLMPGGVLVTLKKNEILDLLSYVQSGGDANSEFFKK